MKLSTLIFYRREHFIVVSNFHLPRLRWQREHCVAVAWVLLGWPPPPAFVSFYWERAGSYTGANISNAPFSLFHICYCFLYFYVPFFVIFILFLSLLGIYLYLSLVLVYCFFLYHSLDSFIDIYFFILFFHLQLNIIFYCYSKKMWPFICHA
jgi:hypothetical protein